MTGRNRLGEQRAADFAHPLIDRARPIRFRVNGMAIDGLAGDTVLSALLAGGIDTVGIHEGRSVALDEQTAPAIALAGNAGRPDLAMPMPLCPALDGLEFVTLGPRQSTTPLSRALRLVSGPPRSLGHDLDKGLMLPGGWIATPSSRELEADMVVVGAGVAGLSAALQAARRKTRVIVIERAPVPGGMSGFFGKAEGEPAPEAMIAGLAAEATANDRITLITRTEAFDIADGAAEAVQIVTEGGIPRPERLALKARHILLATGCAERLPVFPGNRLPGVVQSGFAWRMAARFNVWPGMNAHVHTVTNVGYRLTMLGHDSGRTVARASDPRLAPQTRFIEFSKAYGVRLGWGAVLSSAEPERGGRSITIRHRNNQGGTMQDDRISVDRLIVSGGWQPDLALWLRAGGDVRWDAKRQRVVPEGDAPGVAFIGSAAGFASLRGCAESGTAMAEWLLRGKEIPVSDLQIDEMFESRDGALSLSPSAQGDAAPAYLGPVGLQMLSGPRRRSLPAFFRQPAPSAPAPETAADPRDIPGLVLSGTVAPETVPAFCAERCVLPLGFAAAPLPVSTPATDATPIWLAGRFGPRQVRWRLALADGRSAAPGCLIFANTDGTDPFDALGVILSLSGEALLTQGRWRSGDTLYVRDGLTCTPARLEEKIG